MGVVECGGRVDNGEAESESLEIGSQVQTSFHQHNNSKNDVPNEGYEERIQHREDPQTQETSGFWLIGG